MNDTIAQLLMSQMQPVIDTDSLVDQEEYLIAVRIGDGEEIIWDVETWLNDIRCFSNSVYSFHLAEVVFILQLPDVRGL